MTPIILFYFSSLPIPHETDPTSEMQEEDSGIMFTKPTSHHIPQLGLFQHLEKEEVERAVLPESPLPPVRLYLTTDEVRGIKKEAKILKKLAFKRPAWKVSRFEPWQLIEE